MYNEHGNGSTIITGIEHLLGFKQCPVKPFHLNLAKHLQYREREKREREREELRAVTISNASYFWFDVSLAEVNMIDESRSEKWDESEEHLSLSSLARVACDWAEV